MDPLAHIATHPTIASLIDAATADLQALHRHPATARGSGVTSSEGVLRGARLAALLGNAPETQLVDAYSVLAPDVREQTARTFIKAPLQVLARLDVLVGGSGRPRDERAAAGRLALLGKIVTAGPHQAVIPAVVQGEIIAHELFGPRSMAVGLAAARVSAVASGFDPRGLAVPEVYYNRHRSELAALGAGFGQPAGVVPFVAYYLAAMRAGVVEARGIANAAQQSGVGGPACGRR